MSKSLLLFCLLIFFFITTFAQPTASFTYNYNSCAIAPVVTFTNTSTGFINIYLWNFGDSTTSNMLDPVHTYSHPGLYNVTLIVGDSTSVTVYDTVSQQVNINLKTGAATIEKTFDTLGCGKMVLILKANSQFLDTTDGLSYKWLVQNNNYNTANFYTQTIADTIIPPGFLYFSVGITDKNGCRGGSGDTLSFTSTLPVLPSAGADQLVANRECNNDSGWTNYYFDNNTPDDFKDDSLVLSLKKNGNNIGTIGDGTFQVKTIATSGAGSNSAILLTNPLITNPSGYYVMNKYWIVTPTHQPSTPVGVRFYYNDQDIKDVNGSSPNHDIYFENLIFYKTHGGNPDPTTNLSGANYITSLSYNSYNADTTHWTDPAFDFNTDKHTAEFEVGSFSGGGGGATGNGNSILPLQITSFTATHDNYKVTLQWKAGQELNVDRYEVQESADGKTFSTIGTVYKPDSKTASDAYTFSYTASKLNKTYYRLYVIDKDGNRHISNTVFLLFDALALDIFPNPSNSYIYLNDKSFANKPVTIKVFDLSGKCILYRKALYNAPLKLDVSKLTNGKYILALSGNNIIKHGNFIIIR